MSKSPSSDDLLDNHIYEAKEVTLRTSTIKQLEFGVIIASSLVLIIHILWWQAWGQVYFSYILLLLIFPTIYMLLWHSKSKRFDALQEEVVLYDNGMTVLAILTIISGILGIIFLFGIVYIVHGFETLSLTRKARRQINGQ